MELQRKAARACSQLSTPAPAPAAASAAAAPPPPPPPAAAALLRRTARVQRRSMPSTSASMRVPAPPHTSMCGRSARVSPVHGAHRHKPEPRVVANQPLVPGLVVCGRQRWWGGCGGGCRSLHGTPLQRAGSTAHWVSHAEHDSITHTVDGQNLGLGATGGKAKGKGGGAHEQAQAQHAAARALPLLASQPAGEHLQRVAVHQPQAAAPGSQR